MLKKIVFPNIEAERLKVGMSKNDLSAVIGITPRSYYNYTRGVAPIPSKILLKLSSVFQCSIDYLLS